MKFFGENFLTFFKKFFKYLIINILQKIKIFISWNNFVTFLLHYLIDVISHYKITDPTFLFIRGVPSAQLVYELIKKTFINDDKLLRIYKEKLMSVLDNDTIKYEFTE